MPTVNAEFAVETLQFFADAWNRHDVDALMSFMAEDCVFEASAGSEVCGTRYVGFDSVGRRCRGLGNISRCPLGQRTSLCRRRSWRVRVDIHRNTYRRHTRRGPWL